MAQYSHKNIMGRDSGSGWVSSIRKLLRDVYKKPSECDLEDTS
jgi:hypothetical protein